jgi:YVTN family beta-propeller protein
MVVCALLAVGATDVRAQPYAYVLGTRTPPGASSAQQYLTVVNTATNAKVVTLPMGRSCANCLFAQGVAISRDGAEVYVANVWDRTVTVVATAANSVVATIGNDVVGGAPAAVAVSPDNTRLYVTTVGGTVVIDRASRTRTAFVTGSAAQVAFSRDGAQVYITTGSAVRIIDAATLVDVASVPVVGGASALAVSPDGQRLYVGSSCCGPPSAVSVLDVGTRTVLATVPLAANPAALALLPDGSKLFAATGNAGTVSVINPQTNTLTTTIATGTGAFGLALSVDAARLWVTSLANTVLSVNTASNALVGSVPFTQATEGTPQTIVLTPPAFVPPAVPTGLYASTISGNDVTLRWNAPPNTAVQGYILEGGVAPGQTLATLPTGGVAPIFRFIAPSGVFYVRIRALAGGVPGPPSNETRIVVNAPAPPSAPADLLGLVNGDTLALAWRNTSQGGAQSGAVLDVSGTLSVSLPLGMAESFSFAGVPPGTYTFTIKAVGPAGTSAWSSPPVTLTFPGGCSGAPRVPTTFLVSRDGNQLTLSWDNAAAGPAPTSYLITVSGTLAGTFPTTVRSLAGRVGPGTYNLSVRAVNACGQSAATAVVPVTVP